MSKREQYNSLRCCLFAQVKHNAHCGEGLFWKGKKVQVSIATEALWNKKLFRDGKGGQKEC